MCLNGNNYKKKIPCNKYFFIFQIDRATIDFEKCAVKCVDKHMGLIPSMLKTMKSVLASGKPPPMRSE